MILKQNIKRIGLIKSIKTMALGVKTLWGLIIAGGSTVVLTIIIICVIGGVFISIFSGKLEWTEKEVVLTEEVLEIMNERFIEIASNEVGN